VNITLAELKEELRKEFAKAVALYFSPVAAVAKVFRQNFDEIERRAHRKPNQVHFGILKKHDEERASSPQ
jgi:hypothetical protein